MMTFEEWMSAVNRWLEDRDWPGTEDLADYNYRAAYEAGYSPVEAAADALGIARPTVFITETGWTLNDMPAMTEEAMADVDWLAKEYARHPQIKAAFLWSLIGGCLLYTSYGPAMRLVGQAE